MVPAKTIHYYASPGDTQPAYTVYAGITYIDTFFWGYGYTSWPTYSKEWRYAQPFLEKSKDTAYINYEELSSLPYYYIRYSDLLELSEGNRQGMLYYDQWLCKTGLYYSPNLPIFLDIWNVSFLAAGLLLLGLTIFWTYKQPEKNT